MTKFKDYLMKGLAFILKYFPMVGGYSVKDADELMKDPEHYNYRHSSWLKKMEDKLNHKEK